MKRVIGIGNALTDVLVNLRNEEVLHKHNIARGSMSLVDSELQSEVSKEVAGLPHSLSLGGSADNTIRAMARLGSEVGFIGKVGFDNTGDRFEQALRNLGIEGKFSVPTNLRVSVFRLFRPMASALCSHTSELQPRCTPKI